MIKVRWGVVCASLALSQAVVAECEISEAAKQQDPVEVGFCESDAVFVGTVDSRLETVRAYREEGSDRTKHYRIEVSTMKVDKNYKDAKEGKVTMTSDLYDKKTGAYSFELHKEYLVFAKRQPTGEYAGATAACSVQPTLPIADAKQALERLEQHRKGTNKIDCKKIGQKQSP